jgi:hypothetical protein
MGPICGAVKARLYRPNLARLAVRPLNLWGTGTEASGLVWGLVGLFMAAFVTSALALRAQEPPGRPLAFMFGQKVVTASGVAPDGTPYMVTPKKPGVPAAIEDFIPTIIEAFGAGDCGPGFIVWAAELGDLTVLEADDGAARAFMGSRGNFAHRVKGQRGLSRLSPAR